MWLKEICKRFGERKLSNNVKKLKEWQEIKQNMGKYRVEIE